MGLKVILTIFVITFVTDTGFGREFFPVTIYKGKGWTGESSLSYSYDDTCQKFDTGSSFDNNIRSIKFDKEFGCVNVFPTLSRSCEGFAGRILYCEPEKMKDMTLAGIPDVAHQFDSCQITDEEKEKCRRKIEGTSSNNNNNNNKCDNKCGSCNSCCSSCSGCGGCRC